MPPCTSKTPENVGILARFKDMFNQFTDGDDLNARAMGNRIDDIVP